MGTTRNEEHRAAGLRRRDGRSSRQLRGARGAQVVLTGALLITSMHAQPAVARRGVLLEELTWLQAEQILSPDSVVVLPIGAAAKEHGPHLKLKNDFILAEYFKARLLERTNVIVAPTVNYHFYPAFVEYPGSTSLQQNTARDVLVDICRSLARFGPRRFYALNTGISTVRALAPAATLLQADGILLEFTDLPKLLGPIERVVSEQEGGTHADEIETSMLLYIQAESVDMTRAVKDYSRQGEGGLTRRRDSPGTYSATGIWGDPTLATREKGQKVVDAYLAGLLDDIERVRRASLPAPRSRTTADDGTSLVPGGIAAGAALPVEGTSGDERAIRTLASRFEYAWATQNAGAIGALWASDGDMIHPDGAVERGPNAITQNRARLFAQKRYGGTRHPLTVTAIAFRGRDAAVMDGKWQLMGLQSPTAAESIRMEGLFTIVAARIEGTWKIGAWRYSASPPPSPAR